MFSVESLCQSGQRGIPCDHYPWCTGPHHTVTPPPTNYPLDMGPPVSDIWWPGLDTYSRLFIWGTAHPPPHHQCWYLVDAEAHMVDKWIRIKMEWFLVWLIFSSICIWGKVNLNLPFFFKILQNLRKNSYFL